MKYISTILPRKISLKVVLIVPCFLQLVTIVGLVQYFGYNTSRSSVDNLAYRLLDNTSREIIEKVNLYIKIPQESLKMNKTTLKRGDFDLNNIDSLQPYF